MSDGKTESVSCEGCNGWPVAMAEGRRTLALALPMIAGFVAQMLMGIADTVMIGQVGTVPLAAAAFAHNLLNVPMVAGFGLVSAVGVLAAQAYGGQRHQAAGEVMRHGLLVGLICGLATGLGFWLGRGHLTWLGQPAEVLAEAQGYLMLVGWSMVPTMVTQALKQFSEALNRVWPPMYLVLGGVLLNIFLNWLWIFGRLGFPEMGLAGAGWATLVARVATAVGMALYVTREVRLGPWLPSRWWGRVQAAVVRDLMRLGTPVATQHLLEVGAFVAAALMMGWIGPTAMAAHQIAIICASTSFMVALGIGMAVSIRVGHAWGAQTPERVWRVGITGLGMTVGVMATFGLIFALGGRGLAELFTPEIEVVTVAAGMLMVAAFFQVFDGLQAVALCALRGMSDVRAPAVIAVVAYWLVALPLGYGLCFELELGPLGMWTGLAAGLAVAAAILIWRFWLLSRLGLAGKRAGLTEPRKGL